jgi:RimJ/RimL family protein N-acetyltransferase
MNIRCERVDLAEFKPVLAAHVLTLASPVDSYLEDHLLQSRPYRILVDGEGAGWTAIHNQSLITHFSLDAPHRHRGQRVFAQVRKLEQVREAYVPTCDEFFLAHALDEYRLLEKQAYFFQVRPGAQRPLAPTGLTHRLARADDLAQMTTLTGDFFDRMEWRVADGQITVAERDSEIAGFGVIERSTLYAAAASIGMITVEAQRGRGVGTAIIGALLDECARQQLTAIAGCWYYNHFSKQTLEKAGMYTQTRLLKVSY